MTTEADLNSYGSSSTRRVQRNFPTQPGRFQCRDCTKSFGRIEHLTRHSRSHSRERSFKCSHCRKGFYRLDALTRHEKIHEEPKRALTERGSRACLECSTARRKCSKESPCSACQQRSIECHFPTQTKAKSLASGILGQRDEPVSDDAATARIQASPTSWPGMTRSPGDHTSGTTYLHSSEANHAESFTPGMEHQSDQQSHNDHRSSGTPAEQVVNETRLLAGSRQTLWGGPLIDRAMSNPTDVGLTTYPGNWLEGNFSSINWLPEDWTPEFQLADDIRLEPLSDGRHIDFGRAPLVGQTGSNQFGSLPEDISPHGAGQQRHWGHTGTPQESHGSEKAVSISTPQSTPSTGHYYVDGDGARLPRVRKSPYQIIETFTPQSPHQLDQNSCLSFWFPDHNESHTPAVISTQNVNQISQEVYGQITEIFNLTCITSTHFPPYYNTNFPSLDTLSKYVNLYMDNFHPIFPFIHAASFNLCSSHWLMVLALAAIGSHYQHGDGIDTSQHPLAMHELVRRALKIVEEGNRNSKTDVLLLTQVKLLISIGMVYCGDKRLLEAAKSNHHDLVEFCSTEWSKPESASGGEMGSGLERAEHEWRGWYEAEGRRRTGYCIWLLDCMWAFHLQTRPLLSLEDAIVAVPCQEVLWDAPSAIDWQQLYACSTPSPSLHSAIQLAYIEKRLQSSMGEFSRILCIHALFRRIWDVETYFQKPLTLWNPTAERQDIKTIEDSIPIWLPGIPTYSKWRNSTCDVLDILHWHANSVIGAASGMEHPTVLHLHLARVILLTPYRKIVTLAHIMTGETTTDTKKEDIKRLRKHVQRWAMEDQHKARLAMIHAGVLFWHVRRYSTDAFYEPSSVFLATLALWAYGTFAQRPLAEAPQADGDADGLFPTSMQLDRPADDELVQLYVKRGATMKANITGVGNLCSPKGPVRVLVEGRKLLTGLKRWGCGKGAIQTLSALVEMCQGDVGR